MKGSGSRLVSLKAAFQRHLQKKFALRFHMFLILLATTLSGVVFSKILLLTGIADIRLRYPLIVVLSYLVFFACIKMWLYWMASVRGSGATGTTDLLDVPVVSPGGGAGEAAVRGGGGEFLGGGASGAFDEPETAAAASMVVPDEAVPSSSGGGTTGGGIGDAVDSLGDADDIAVIIILVILVAAIMASAIFVIYSAPAILAEAAFQGILAASLAKRTRFAAEGSWVSSVLRNTWKPFAATLGITVLASIALHIYCPYASKLSEIIGSLLGP